MTDTTRFVRITFLLNFARASVHALYGPFLLASGVSIEGMNALRALSFLCPLLCEVPAGVVADRVGRLLLVRAATLCCASGYAVYLIGYTFPHFMIAAVLTSLGFALQAGALEAWAIDTLSVDSRASSVGQLLARGRAAEATGLMIGSLTGALVAAIYLDGMWIIGIGGMAMALVLARSTRSEVARIRDRASLPPASVWSTVTSNKSLLVLMLLSAALFFFNQPVLLYWPVYFEQHLKLPEVYGINLNHATVGIVVVCSHLAAIGGTRVLLSGTRAHARTLCVSGLLMAAPFIVCGMTTEALLLACIYCVSYFGRGLFEPTLKTLMNDQIPQGSRAAVLSTNRLVSRGGSLLALATIGTIAASSLTAAFVVAAGTFVVAIPFLTLLYGAYERHRPVRHQSEAAV